jgi:hypothetical protein
MRLLLLIVLLPMLSVSVVYFLPRTYTSTARLLAVTRYQIISLTGVESNLQDTEAGTQATALNEFLQTQEFDLHVASETSLASTLDPAIQADPQARDQALFDDISKHAVATALGTNTFSVVYTNKNAQLAQAVVAAIIDQYGAWSVNVSVTEGNKLLASYTASLNTAKTDFQSASNNLNAYLNAHSELRNNQSAQNADLQYLQLYNAYSQAETEVNSWQGKINALNAVMKPLTDSGASAFFQVLDPPPVPERADSRTKNFLLGGALGLVLALLIGTVAIVVTLRRDRSIYVPVDLAKLTEMPVVMQIPHLSRREVRATLAPATAPTTATSKIVSAKNVNGHLNGNNRPARGS